MRLKFLLCSNFLRGSISESVIFRLTGSESPGRRGVLLGGTGWEIGGGYLLFLEMQQILEPISSFTSSGSLGVRSRYLNYLKLS